MFNIALNTFKEIVRSKMLYLIAFFAVLFLIFSLFLSQLTIGDPTKIIVDFGLAMIEIFGLIATVYVGSQLLFKEIDGKTIFLILSKPISRKDFILGKFLGFSYIISLIIFFQSVIFLLLLVFKGIHIEPLILWSLFFTFLKLEVLIALVLFLSTFVSNILTIMVSLMVYIISHSFSLLLDGAFRSGSAIQIYGTKFLNLLFPPFEALNLKDYIGSPVVFSNIFFAQNIIYAVIYGIILLLLTVLIFNRKTFEN